MVSGKSKSCGIHCVRCSNWSSYFQHEHELCVRSSLPSFEICVWKSFLALFLLPHIWSYPPRTFYNGEGRRGNICKGKLRARCIFERVIFKNINIYNWIYLRVPFNESYIFDKKYKEHFFETLQPICLYENPSSMLYSKSQSLIHSQSIWLRTHLAIRLIIPIYISSWNDNTSFVSWKRNLRLKTFWRFQIPNCAVIKNDLHTLSTHVYPLSRIGMVK